MAAEPVQLFSPTGNRYTPSDREGAYVAWKLPAGRSLRKTAELTGVSLGTLSNWSRDDRWQDRARREDDEDAGLLRSALAGVATAEALKSIQTAAALRDDASGKTPPKVRLDAAVWLAGIAGVSPLKKSLDLTDRTAAVPRAYSIDLDACTPEELLALEAEIVEQGRDAS